jgi:hypothetical protein
MPQRLAAPQAEGGGTTTATPAALKQHLQELDKLLAAGEGVQAEKQATDFASSLDLSGYGKAAQVSHLPGAGIALLSHIWSLNHLVSQPCVTVS